MLVEDQCKHVIRNKFGRHIHQQLGHLEHLWVAELGSLAEEAVQYADDTSTSSLLQCTAWHCMALDHIAWHCIALHNMGDIYLRHDGYSCSGGVHTPLCLCCRHALNTVHAALKL